jgi:hypothetical protein
MVSFPVSLNHRGDRDTGKTERHVQGWPTEDLVAKKVLSELVIFELGSE